MTSSITSLVCLYSFVYKGNGGASTHWKTHCLFRRSITKLAMAEQFEMPRVKLGTQGLEVSKLGYGCMGLSGVYNNPVPEEEGIAIIKEAFSKGITLFDTANVYGANHANECLVGKAIKQLPREKVQLATKFGRAGVDASGVIIKGTPEYVRSCCEASLKSLDVDYIDLYYIHRIDATVPIEYTMGELKKLVNEGKIKYIGLCEANSDTIRRAHAVHPITALQMDYSLWVRDIEEEIIPLCRELGIGIVPYSPLGRGFFAGKAIVESVENNSLTDHPRLQGENFDKNKVFYFRLEALAKKHGCTTAQLALAWVLHQGDDVVPIPGMLSVSHLLCNLVGDLDGKEIEHSRCMDNWISVQTGPDIIVLDNQAFPLGSSYALVLVRLRLCDPYLYAFGFLVRQSLLHGWV